MLPGINVEDVKAYNNSLKAHRERASKLKAEIEFNTNELNRVCAELTKELGVQVTTDNLEAIYNERVAKINNSLSTGKEILKRIAEEEAAAQNFSAHLKNSIEAQNLQIENVNQPVQAIQNLNSSLQFDISNQPVPDVPNLNISNDLFKSIDDKDEKAPFIGGSIQI